MAEPATGGDLLPIVWMDGIVIKVQQDKQVINKAAHIILGINLRGEKEVLGLWIAENEGAKFWLSVLTEIRNRGVQDIYIACMDGLTGLPGAVQSVFPQALTQRCIVHLVRASLRYVSDKDCRALVTALKRIYRSATADEAARELEALEAQWGKQYPSVVRLWRNNWDNIIPFFQFMPAIRKIVYTTNAIESMNMVLRKFTRNRRIFPNDDAALKGLFVAIRGSLEKLENHPKLEAGFAVFSDHVRGRSCAFIYALKNELHSWLDRLMCAPAQHMSSAFVYATDSCNNVINLISGISPTH